MQTWLEIEEFSKLVGLEISTIEAMIEEEPNSLLKQKMNTVSLKSITMPMPSFLQRKVRLSR